MNIVDDLLNAPNADELLRDLAITSITPATSFPVFNTNPSPVSQRGVVFFRAQNNLTDDLQKKLNQRLGELTNKPQDSTLHIHPVLNNTSEFGIADAQISRISSVARKNLFQQDGDKPRRRYDSAQWHSDIQFEPVPADYTSLRLTTLPSNGGDTLYVLSSTLDLLIC